MKPRKITGIIEKALTNPDKRIVFLWGPRQIGKSTILNHFYQKFGGSYFTFDDLQDRRLFVPEIEKLTSILKNRSNNIHSRLVYIDEIQNHPEASTAIKLLSDQTDYIVFATGSSELRAKTNNFDTLAGRYREFTLFPLTIDEVAAFSGEKSDFTDRPDFAQIEKFKKYLEPMLIFGSYPHIILSSNKPAELKNITQNSIIKDIVSIYNLKNIDLIFNLLRLLAMQTGNLINVTEICSSLGSTKQTVDNYLSILSKNRVIFFLEPFRTNKRRAFLARKKIYFYDLGVRNSLIEDFRPLEVRTDLGAMFENLVILSFLRHATYHDDFLKLHYYRELTGGQKEIDLITEDINGNKAAFEIKYTKGIVTNFPELGISEYKIISRENAPEFLI